MLPLRNVRVYMDRLDVGHCGVFHSRACTRHEGSYVAGCDRIVFGCDDMDFGPQT